jgi:hypothetical protein
VGKKRYVIINNDGNLINPVKVKDHEDGTYKIKGKSVGTPGVSWCGCPGADTTTYNRGRRQCSRCLKIS